MSTLLQRLQQQLANERDPDQAAEWRALIASIHARAGEFDDARKTIIEARQQSFEKGKFGTLWVMFAEGLLYFYEDQSPQALDRVTRAQMLASAFSHRRLVALTSAWKAHMEFDNSNFTGMIDSIELAAKHVKNSEHDTKARVATVLMNAFAFAGSSEASKKWFAVARKHALAHGDRATIDALIFNSAALALSNLRVSSCSTAPNIDEVKRLRSESASSSNFSSLVKSDALTNHSHLLEARILILEENYGLAKQWIARSQQEAPFAKNHFSNDYAELEMIFCDAMSGDLGELKSRRSEEFKFDNFDIDEKIVGVWMLWKMATLAPDFGNLNQLRLQLDGLIEAYAELRKELILKLHTFSRGEASITVA